MKIDVTQPIKEYDGTNVTEPGTKEAPILPLRTFLVNALATAPSRNDPENPGPQARMTTESKERRFAISTKLWSKKNVDLKSTEIAFIIECVDAAYDSPLVCGRIKQVLEGEGQSVPEPEEVGEDRAANESLAKNGKETSER